jgi:hypothetical protein
MVAARLFLENTTDVTLDSGPDKSMLGCWDQGSKVHNGLLVAGLGLRNQLLCSRLQSDIITARGPSRSSGPRVGHCSRLQRISIPDGGHELGVFSGAGNVTCVKR